MSASHRIPAIFYGHGSPMNALEDNPYTCAWESFGTRFPHPKAILAISAHWTTRGTAVTAMSSPKTIHDFGGFPQALFDMRYPAPGDPALAARVAQLLAPLPVHLDQSWGLDHGTWSVLVKTYPDANIPVLQLSLDITQPPAYHFALGQKLATLRDEGVMIIASGNVVHNLGRLDPRSKGFDWANRFNDAIRLSIQNGQFDQVVDYQSLGQDATLSVPTSEHFLPLLYVLGARIGDEPVEIVTEGMEMGAISMMSVVLGGG
ncbi:MAG: 4,5-DOPA dioxygenase extradiol [Undibacterium sp.]|uniref:4,5-DOPA-extradiol-dioxygenase n=1 Tax=Undibacterium sp. TaxID=1914977 RepID=UPI0027282CAC|nr:4,5-DOPA dioxygenase extradiol [Undibacterium sp.]MDO8654165.1 4,5-DOPA dioxygenase extradiol [Undibacterium sp.]